MTSSALPLDAPRRALVQRITDALADDGAAGQWSLHWGQQPPFGYFSPAFVEELAIGMPIVDRSRRFAHLQSRALVYPAPLRASIVQSMLWNAEFTLTAFAPKYAHAGDAYGYAGCATRTSFALVQALFALAMRWPVPDRIAIERLASLPNVPAGWPQRLEPLLAHTGATSDEMRAHRTRLASLFELTRAVAGDLYVSRTLPARPA